MQRELVERARRGDHDAFAVLAAAAISRLDGAARLILHDPDQAKDAVQETLVRAWRDLRTLRDPDRFDAWLHRLLVNSCLNEAKRLRRHRFDVELSPLDGPSIADGAAAVADRDELDRGFRRLTPEARAIVVLHHYLDLPLPEVALIVGIPVGTAKSRLHRALQADARLAGGRCSTRPGAGGKGARMMPDDRFGGTVSVWLQERAGTGAPDYLDDILGRTARTRQRPGWTSIERWPPMDISASRTVLPSRFPLRALALLAILALLLAAVVAVGVGSQQQRLPAPFGLAANGLIAYGAADGDIHAFDPLTGATRPLITGPAHDETPVFSPDGSKFLFARADGPLVRTRRDR